MLLVMNSTAITSLITPCPPQVSGADISRGGGHSRWRMWQWMKLLKVVKWFRILAATSGRCEPTNPPSADRNDCRSCEPSYTDIIDGCCATLLTCR